MDGRGKRDGPTGHVSENRTARAPAFDFTVALCYDFAGQGAGESAVALRHGRERRVLNRKKLLIRILILFYVAGVFYLDSYFTPGFALPAAPYVIPILIAAYFLSSRAVLVVGISVAAAQFVAAVIQASETTAWLYLLNLCIVAIVTLLGAVLNNKMRRETELAAERARLLEQLGYEHARFEAVLTQMPEGVIIAEAPSMKLILANEQATNVLRHPFLSSPDYSDWAKYRPSHPDGRPYARQDLPLYRSIHAGDVLKDMDVCFAREDGTRVTFRNSSAPVRDNDGRIVAGVLIFRDVTRRRRAEQFQREYVSLVSHDLQNPLAAILAEARFLLRGFEKAGDNARQWQSASDITVAAQQMDAMIQSLADSARLESGQLKLEKRLVRLTDFLPGLLGHAGGLKSRVKLDIASDGTAVLADPGCLERILTNLLTNAAKYSSPDTDVLLRGRSSDGDVVISVSDQGDGIPSDDLPHVFDRFYRGERVPKTEGVGLGLYITKLLVEAHGGRIWVESEVGKGSTFSFVLAPAR